MSEFGSINLEEIGGEVERLTEQAEAGTGGMGNYLDNYVQMPKGAGNVTIRLLPPAKGGKLFQYTRLISVNGRNVHCPKPLVNGKWDKNTPNPLVDYYNALWRQIDALEKEGGSKDMIEKLKSDARAIKPVERYYYNAIVRSATDKDGNVQKNVGPKILSVGKTLHKMIISAIVPGTDTYIGNVVDPENGYDFVIRKELVGSGSNAYPKYERSSFARDKSPLGTPEEVAKWVSTLHDLTTLRRPATVEVLEYELAVLRGLIKDTKATGGSGFSIEEFDKKYKTGTTAPATTTVANTSTEPVVEDKVIDNAAFDAELDALSASMNS
jgi:hypothetical protein